MYVHARSSSFGPSGENAESRLLNQHGQELEISRCSVKGCESLDSSSKLCARKRRSLDAANVSRSPDMSYTSANSPAAFISSLFPRRSTLNSQAGAPSNYITDSRLPASTPSLPETRQTSPKMRHDAKALLAALASTCSSQQKHVTTLAPSLVVSGETATNAAKRINACASFSHSSTSNAASSVVSFNASAGPIRSLSASPASRRSRPNLNTRGVSLASPQICAIEANPPHLTLSVRSGRPHRRRSSLKTSESLLKSGATAWQVDDG